MTTSTQLTWPFSGNFLETRCQEINQSRGQQERKYFQLLKLIQEAITSISGIEELQAICQDFSLIKKIMPDEIQQRNAIIQTQGDVALKLSTKIGDFLKSIQNGLKQSYNRSELDELEKRMTVIKKEFEEHLNLGLTQTLQKCQRIYYDKAGLISFASKHDIPMRREDNFSSSPAQYSSSSQVTHTKSESRKKIYPILSIDGGGIRGIIPATLLVEIEKITSEPIANLFSLIGGTSTGGILTLGLSKPHENESRRPQYRAQDLLKIYTEEHAQIFRANPNFAPCPENLDLLEKLEWRLKYSKYLSPSPFFDIKLNPCRLSSALTDVLVTTNGFDEVTSKFSSVGLSALSLVPGFMSGLMGHPNPSYLSHDSFPKTVHYFNKKGLNTVSYRLGELQKRYPILGKTSSSDEKFSSNKPYKICPEVEQEFLMSFAAQVTSAAPTFFPVVQQDSNILMDGGVLQNNPAIPCVLESLNNNIALEDLFMVSLGTGVVSNSLSSSSDLVSSVLSTWFHITQPDEQTEEILEGMLSWGAYHRFQYHFAQIPPELDDTQPKTIQLLQEKGKELVEENEDIIRVICKILKPESF